MLRYRILYIASRATTGILLLPRDANADNETKKKKGRESKFPEEIEHEMTKMRISTCKYETETQEEEKQINPKLL